MALSMGFKALVSLHPAIQATELLTFTLAGLTPAEHTSLSWTHNRSPLLRKALRSGPNLTRIQISCIIRLTMLQSNET